MSNSWWRNCNSGWVAEMQLDKVEISGATSLFCWIKYRDNEELANENQGYNVPLANHRTKDWNATTNRLSINLSIKQTNVDPMMK